MRGTDGTRTREALRLVAPAALLACAIAVAIVVLRSGSTYEVNLTFQNAGRLVEGGEAQIAGRVVGSITSVEVGRDNRAHVELKLDDEDAFPLHEGTRAQIRAVGAGTITNNFVDLHPGPRGAPELPDGATLPAAHVAGIVDLDAILSSLDPATRASIRQLVDRSADIFAGSGARHFNSMLAKLSPALAELDPLSQELGSDGARIERLIQTAAVTATALRSRREHVSGSVGHTARALTAIASQRDDLARALDSAPATMRAGRTTLRHLVATTSALRPTLRLVPATARPLGPTLDDLAVTARRATPVVRDLRPQLPRLQTALRGLRRLEPEAAGGLRATSDALTSIQPISHGVRVYGADFILGLFNGLLAIVSGNYNKAGHYAHVTFAQPPETLIGGQAGAALRKLVPNLTLGLFRTQTKILRRCPGGANPTAPDGSSPWNVGRELCDPKDNLAQDVNTP